MSSLDDSSSTVTLYLDHSLSEVADAGDCDPLSETICIESEPERQLNSENPLSTQSQATTRSLNTDLLYDCSLCKQISDYRRTSYMCLDCLQDYRVLTRICRFCVAIETILDRTSAYSEWNTDGSFSILIRHLHKPPGADTAELHRLHCVPAPQEHNNR